MLTSCAGDNALPSACRAFLANGPVDEREHQQYAERTENESERCPEQPAVSFEREQSCQEERQCGGDERGDRRSYPVQDIRSLPLPRAQPLNAAIDLPCHE